MTTGLQELWLFQLTTTVKVRASTLSSTLSSGWLLHVSVSDVIHCQHMDPCPFTQRPQATIPHRIFKNITTDI